MNCLHDRDLLLWSEEQCALLRTKDFEKLDIEYLLEELDAVGRSDQHALHSYLVVLLTHLLKKEYQPGMLSKSWIKSIINSRGEINRILKRHPSYKRFIPEEIESAYRLARKNAILETGLKSEIFPKTNPYSLDYLLFEEEFEI